MAINTATKSLATIRIRIFSISPEKGTYKRVGR